MIGELLGLDTLELALVLMEVVVVGLGLAISYIAFRGYRKHRSRPMFFVSLGFVLLVGGPAVLAVLFLSPAPISQGATLVLNRASSVAGMACILYGLWVDPE